MAMQREELGKLAAFLGAALIIAGLIRYNILGVWGWNAGFAIAGAVLFIAGLALNGSAIIGIFTGRSGKLGTNTAILSVAVIGILAIVNLLGYRHHKRYDLTSEQLFSLSDQTRTILSKLQTDVKVMKFTQQEDQGLKDLMDEYKGVTPRIKYESIDPQTKLEVAKQYKVQKLGETVIAAGERVEKIEASPISEQELTNAILKITSDKLKTVCFSEGHSERGLADSGAEGLSVANDRLKAENYQLKSVMLASGQQVPSECSVLVIAGPKQALLPHEVSMVGKYLDEGGKALFLVDPDTDPNLGEVFKKWNIEIETNTVVDPSLQNRLSGLGAASAMVTSFGSHPITSKMTRSLTVFPFAREVKVGKETGTGVNAQSLLTTSNESWGEKVIKAGVEVKYDDGVDSKGPLTIGVAGSKSLGENKEARIAVIGDSDFATNQGLRFGRNTDLLLNSVNWLAQDENLISIRPKAATNRSVDMTESQQRLFFWLCVAFLPLSVMATGAYVWWKRR